MKFGYSVKYNDRWYAPGEEIPLEKPSKVIEKTEKPQPKKQAKKTKGE